ncbi:MAG: hypothetical protein IJS22_03940 [Lachnospiraceae bacterium]|nr:hypothetical protein [Lachnospiraceae bacterium]
MKIRRYLFTTLMLLFILTAAGCGQTRESRQISYYDSTDNANEYTLTRGSLRFSLDGSTSYFTLTDTRSGQVWSSIPEGAGSDPLADATMKKWMQSTLILTYTSADGLASVYDNYTNSISQGSFAVSGDEDSVRVDYLIGEDEKVYILPEVVGADRYGAYLDQMEKSATSTVKSLYKKIDSEKLSDEEKESMKEQYPLLGEETVIYTLRNGAAEYKYAEAQESFAAAGYTHEDYLADRSSTDNAGDLLQFNVSVVYTLTDDALKVSIPAGSISYPDGLPVTSIQLLPFFMAGTDSDEGYLLVPDGGGAQIDFNSRRGNSEAVMSKVYGWDMALGKDKMITENKVSFPVFAAVRNGRSLMAIVTEGDEQLTLEANVSGARNSLNYISPSFEIVHGDQVFVSGKSSVQVMIFETEQPRSDTEVLYIPGESGSYTDMALRYRSYLQDTYGLTPISEEGLPVVIELIGAVDHVTQVAGIPASRPMVCTDISEAEEIVDGLIAEDIGNISVKYTGVLNGGIRQKSLQRQDLLTDVASEEELGALSEKIAASGGRLYLGAWAMRVKDTSAFDGFNANSDAIRSTISDVVEAAPYNKVTYRQKTAEKYYILNSRSQREALAGLRGYALALGFGGVAAEDIGSELSSDFNKNSHTTRAEMMRMQQEELAAMREQGLGVMINTGNAYAAPYADVILNMDLTGSSYNLTNRQVPFYQIALHGLVAYTGRAVNMAGDHETNILRSIEYGAGISAVFAETDAADLQMTGYTEYSTALYDRWKDTLTQLCRDLNEQLGHTACLSITGHEYLSDTLTCTTYGDGTRVYVNYGYEEALCDGAHIAARDYLVIR